ncbi:hypothetical protein NQZ68_017911 [Dissostichus eleginoides]|nr:hypothetical protein NQZ68_017911 [Dissostichus eleginoides]
MESFTLIAAVLLCSLSWTSASVSQTVEVQPGEEVTLLCPNISIRPTQSDWFRVLNRTKPSCVSSIYGADGEASYCDGYQHGKVEMSSNLTTVFLKIKQVDISDSGLYFCGFYIGKSTVFSSAIQLNVEGNGESDYDGYDFETKKEPDEMTYLMSLILGCLAFLLTIVVIFLAVKIRKLQRDANEESQPQRPQNMCSDELNYAALSFQAKPKISRRPASERELEPNTSPHVPRGTPVRALAAAPPFPALNVNAQRAEQTVSHSVRQATAGWTSASVSQTVEVQPGEEVTLLCPNISIRPTQSDWFRVLNRTKPSCVSSIYGADGEASYCDGYQHGKLEMSSNLTTVFLKIKQVDISDSGLYFCGFYIGKSTVFSSAIQLNVEGNGESDYDGYDFETKKEPDEMTYLMSLILGCLAFLLTIVVIVLAVKVRKLQRDANEESQPQRPQNMCSDELNYAALSFQAKPKISRRPASERELEPNVVYAATR